MLKHDSQALRHPEAKETTMTNVILSVNAGSSSVKISVYTARAYGKPVQHAEAQVNGLTSPPPKLTYVREGVTVAKDQDLTNDKRLKDNSQDSAFRAILATLIDDAHLTQVSQKDDIATMCHRIVHGGDFAPPRSSTTSPPTTVSRNSTT